MATVHIEKVEVSKLELAHLKSCERVYDSLITMFRNCGWESNDEGDVIHKYTGKAYCSWTDLIEAYIDDIEVDNHD